MRRPLNPDGTVPTSNAELEYVDPRGQEAFLELENHLRIFRASLFPDFKDFIFTDQDTGKLVVDPNFYAAHIIPAA